MATVLTLTSVTPGQQANEISVQYTAIPAGPALAIGLVQTDVSQFVITIDAGYNAGTGFLTVADWFAIAAALNADGAIAALVTAVGSASQAALLSADRIKLQDGTDGGAPGAYFFGIGAAPAADAVNTTAQNDGAASGGFSRCAADARQRRSYAPWRPRKVKC